MPPPSPPPPPPHVAVIRVDMAQVGRLDKGTTGLLLFTDDGLLNQLLLNGVPKVPPGPSLAMHRHRSPSGPGSHAQQAAEVAARAIAGIHRIGPPADSNSTHRPAARPAQGRRAARLRLRGGA